MSVFAVYNLKGGVGKTSTTVNLAYLAAQDGAPTLVWDLDPQGAATYYYRIKPKVKGGGARLVRGKRDADPSIKGTDFEHLDVLPADFSYRNMDLDLENTKNPVSRIRRVLKPLRSDYDHLFLDCPDALSTLAESIFFASDVLLIPVIPTTLSLLTFDRMRKHMRKKRRRLPRILPFFSMVDRRKKLHRELVEAYANGKDGFLKNHIPFASAVERMGVRRAPLVSYDRRSRASLAYAALWDEVQQAAQKG